ncbi:hypothetical protein V9T40_006544 [Parthenolecanium corni]|uniref:Polypeptide N-acetylgalactosaminyltransferase n=1 Tax=Parthenolecanium corni TaxID=536013 RepID=A0AAN9Y5M5_9HEMI
MARYTFRLGLIQLKKNKTVKIATGSFILLVLWLLLYFKSNSVHHNVPAVAHYLRTQSVVYVSGLGNYEPKQETLRIGPGEGGKPHRLSSGKENEAGQAMSEYGMNMACSDEISLDRTIPDLRLEECKHWKYPTDLPKTSVIIVFHNEGWSSLLRTVHSVINRTPPELLEEILLVDDFSNKENLGSQLEDYIERFKGKVRLIRNKEREGLIRTRSRGASSATGEVILFLDAHCEVGYNWLPPLLAPIYRDRTTMTVPVIDGIDHNTWEYRTVYEHGHHFRGIFEWGMLYKESELPPAEKKKRKHESEPYKSPTHAGGLFAIDRKYFLEIGGYDPGLLIWGGENFELSFKIWQCGGSIEWVPCSRVGHVYRGFMPYNFGKLADKVKGPLIINNYKRVIEVWFDDKFKEFFYTREPLARYLDVGNISEQLALKDRLKCKSFEWFMENVAYDVYHKFPQLPPNVHWGELKNIAENKCFDTFGNAAPTVIGLGLCHGHGNNQLFRLNAKGQLGHGERCVEADRQSVKLVFCRLGTVDGPWEYNAESRSLLNTDHGKCLTVHPQTKLLMLMRCDSINTFQQWAFKETVPKW